MRFLVFVTGYPIDVSRHHHFAEALATKLGVRWFPLHGYPSDPLPLVGLDEVVVVSADFFLTDPAPDYSVLIQTSRGALQQRSGCVVAQYDVDHRAWSSTSFSVKLTDSKRLERPLGEGVLDLRVRGSHDEKLLWSLVEGVVGAIDQELAPLGR